VSNEGSVNSSVWDRAAPTYGRVGPDHFSYFANRLVQHVPITARASVLDLACGAGAVALAVVEAAPSLGRLIGVDLSLGMVRRAAAALAYRASGAVARMDAQVLAFPDGIFDTVVSGFALDSFPDSNRALTEVLRVLRPGGSLGICTAPGWWWYGDPRWTWHGDLLASLDAPEGRGSIRIDAAGTLKSTIEAVGFNRVSVTTESFDLHFADANQWWEWVWSHGSRHFVEALTPEQLAVYRETAFERIGRRGIDGRMEAILATALKGNS
jgi:O-methyltransferase / aklanonic acid methyltransferase